MVIWKEEIRIDHNGSEISLPKGSVVIDADFQSQHLVIWFMCDEKTTDYENREFFTYMTGQVFQQKNIKHIKTLTSGFLVFHLFEKEQM